jgi:hypothetical protein
MENKPVDIAIEDLKNDIRNAVNNSGLTIGIIQLVLHDITDKIDMQYRVEFTKLKQQFEKENKVE